MSPSQLQPFKFDPKPAGGSDLFYFDWTEWILDSPGEALVTDGTITVTATPIGLTISDIVLNGYVVRCRIAGGTINQTYIVTCKVITTPGGREDSVDVTLYITR